jgi:RimJ/RimL family protein N-acetyltransferase
VAISPVFESPRLRIEPFGERHLTPRYLGWLNNPETMRFSEQRYRRHTLESCREDWRAIQEGPSFFWAILAKEGYLGHIGNMIAYVEPQHGLADVSIMIGEPAARGLGLALEAWQGACDYLLRSAGFRKVSGGTIAPNEPMLKVMRRAGMAEDGRRVGHHLWNGAPVDMLHFAFFRDDYLRRFPRGPFGGGEA